MPEAYASSQSENREKGICLDPRKRDAKMAIGRNRAGAGFFSE
jgi:hypothetical protein